MNANLNVCPNCFQQLPSGSSVCQNCSFDKTKYTPNESALPLYTMLNSQYLLGRVLGQGGFGITYKAFDTFKNKIVAVKEYMPSDYSNRSGKGVYPLSDNPRAEQIFEHGKKSYIEEIKTLYQFENVDGIVKVYTHFQENNTAYLVMEYLDGSNLKAYVKRRGGRITPKKAGEIIIKAANSLMRVHSADILHRDISPENIFIMCNDIDVKLIDFGAARKYIENSEDEKSVLLKPGFAPPEQYTRKGNQGSWTDIYAMAASLYYIVSGTVPQDSMERMREDKLVPLNHLCRDVTPQMAGAVARALEINYTKRTQTCQAFISDLESSGWNAVKTIHPTSPIVPVVPNDTMKRLICNVKCVSGINKGASVNFYPGNIISVGRVRECNNLVPSSEMIISKQHCIIEYNQSVNAFFVTDLSTNGTFTQNGTRLRRNQKERVEPGAILFLSREYIIIQLNTFYS